jgi:flagellar hook-basal body complex protein FliE
MNALSALSLATNPQMRAEMLKQAGLNQPPQALPAGELAGICPQTAPAAAPGVGPAADSFSNVLGHMVQEVNTKQAAAGEAVNGLLGGQNVSLHQAMIAMEEASVSFQLMVEVRNKLLDSYQELMRMQV